jgi:hypothetical protein
VHVKLVIDAPRGRPLVGCRVHLSVTVPGRELVVHAPHHGEFGPIEAVLCEAFHSARRELMTYVGKRRLATRRETIRTFQPQIAKPFALA